MKKLGGDMETILSCITFICLFFSAYCIGTLLFDRNALNNREPIGLLSIVSLAVTGVIAGFFLVSPVALYIVSGLSIIGIIAIVRSSGLRN